tara:strand:+ start:140 stop:457 length:318 start_codon:yes stop_codon:yes gene_type:complete
MAIFGKYAGPIKDTLGKQSITCISNTNVATVITHPDQVGTGSSKLVTMIITSSGNATLEINGVADANSLAITSSDTVIARIASGGTLGARGTASTPTITIHKVVC